MALSDILDAMDAEAGAELAQIARREQETVAQLRAAACAQVEAMRVEHRQAAIAPMRRERARRLNRARLSAQRAASCAREDLYQEALDMAKAQLVALRASAAYVAVLKALLAEALAQIEGPACIRGDLCDAPLLEAMCPDCQVELDLRTLGGIVARSMDGAVVVDNTLETRLARAEPMLRHEFTQWDMSTPTRDSAC